MKRELPREEREKLLRVLKTRFEKNPGRHEGVLWGRVQAKLEADAGKLWSVGEMERTGGEPDVVAFGNKNEIFFFDCSAESPKGRRSGCYDQEGLREREKEGLHPNGSAVGMAEAMGVELLGEREYRELQKVGEFDLKTSSWLKTPSSIRKLGGALFADRRFDTIFVYHNTAPCFYGARGFRTSLKI